MAQLAVSLGDKERAFTYLTLLFISGAVHGLLWNSVDYLNTYKTLPLFYEFKKIAFEKFWGKKYETFIEKPSGKTGNYVNELSSHTYELWLLYQYSWLPLAAALPVYCVLLYTAVWQNSVVYAVFLVVSIAALVLLTKPINKQQRLATDASASNAGQIFDSYANFVNVFAFGAQKKEIARNNQQLDHVITQEVGAQVRVTNYWAISAFLVRVVLWAAILFYSWHLYNSGAISFEVLIISVAVLLDFTANYWEIVESIGEWSRRSASYKESYSYLFPGQNIVKESFDKPETANDLVERQIDFNESITIKNVSFAYPDAATQGVLHDVSITVAKNEKIGIVGKSGSGKSTLIKILLGFYTPDKGQIVVDGVSVTSEELAQLYAYVPQDTTLFQESLLYNIAYAAKGEVTIEQIEAAAKKAYIHDFIDQLPEKYETTVGERGVKLSLGQRQRIAIARAFLKESELLLLDEATSALDSETESLVQKSFEQLWGNKSVIAIAHRLSTLNNVDRIIVMDEGRIVEEGTKAELLALGGHFADLWKHQKKGMI